MMEMTIEAFVMLIWHYFRPNQEEGESQSAAIMQYGRVKGWLEEADILWADRAIEKRIAARIVHEFLRKECREADEADYHLARQLEDLYDCRTCVNHVAQVFDKGIICARTEHRENEKAIDKKSGILFGMQDFISYEEACKIVERMFKKELRIVYGAKKRVLARAMRLSFEEAMTLVDREHSLLIDVRTRNEYDEKHLPHALNMPLVDFLKKPHMPNLDETAPLLLYCTHGYNSEIAAQYLIENGYEKVYYFGLSNE